MKKYKFPLLILLFVLALNGCTQSDSQTTTPGSTETELKEMTLEELKQFDGKNGNPAYIAVDGVIYDVTNVSQWKDGTHNGYNAGNDLTNEITNLSPHGKRVLNNLKVVGNLK